MLRFREIPICKFINCFWNVSYHSSLSRLELTKFKQAYLTSLQSCFFFENEASNQNILFHHFFLISSTFLVLSSPAGLHVYFVTQCRPRLKIVPSRQTVNSSELQLSRDEQRAVRTYKFLVDLITRSLINYWKSSDRFPPSSFFQRFLGPRLFAFLFSWATSLPWRRLGIHNPRRLEILPPVPRFPGCHLGTAKFLRYRVIGEVKEGPLGWLFLRTVKSAESVEYRLDRLKPGGERERPCSFACLGPACHGMKSRMEKDDGV